jgi:hypothetical protein
MGKRAVKDKATVGQLMIQGAREALAHKRGTLRTGATPEEVREVKGQ